MKNVLDFISFNNNVIFQAARKSLLSINYKIYPHSVLIMDARFLEKLLNIALQIIEFHAFYSSLT